MISICIYYTRYRIVYDVITVYDIISTSTHNCFDIATKGGKTTPIIEIGPLGYPPPTGTRQMLQLGLYSTCRAMPFWRPGTRVPGTNTGTRVPGTNTGTRVPGNILTFVLVSVTESGEAYDSVRYRNEYWHLVRKYKELRFRFDAQATWSCILLVYETLAYRDIISGLNVLNMYKYFAWGLVLLGVSLSKFAQMRRLWSTTLMGDCSTYLGLLLLSYAYCWILYCCMYNILVRRDNSSKGEGALQVLHTLWTHTRNSGAHCTLHNNCTSTHSLHSKETKNKIQTKTKRAKRGIWNTLL